MTFFVILLCQATQKIETSDTDYIPTKYTGIHIAFPSALKEIRSGKHLQRVTLKKYSIEPKLCLVSLLRCYVSKTQKIRKSLTKLLISFSKPHRAASTRTVSRWLKSSLENASIDVNMYQGHCRLTASASKASLHGLNIQSILRAGGWSRESC